jgi:hypothetical protein
VNSEVHSAVRYRTESWSPVAIESPAAGLHAGIGRRSADAVVASPPTPVLIGQVAPPEVGQRCARSDSKHVQRVDQVGSDGAQVLPAVAEVELARKPFSGFESGERDRPLVRDVVLVGNADQAAVRHHELM